MIPQDIEALLDRMDEVAESLVLERSGLLVALVFPKSDSEGRLPTEGHIVTFRHILLATRKNCRKQNYKDKVYI